MLWLDLKPFDSALSSGHQASVLQLVLDIAECILKHVQLVIKSDNLWVKKLLNIF